MCRRLTQDNDKQHDGDHAQNDHHLHVGPPLLALQLAGLLLELGCALLQLIGPLAQLRQLLVPLQHLLHVHPHDADHLVHLGLCLLQSLVGRIVVADLMMVPVLVVIVVVRVRWWRKYGKTEQYYVCLWGKLTFINTSRSWELHSAQKQGKSLGYFSLVIDTFRVLSRASKISHLLALSSIGSGDKHYPAFMDLKSLFLCFSQFNTLTDN